MSESRERTVEYAESSTVRGELAARDGREAIEAVERGEVEPAPVARLVNITALRVEGDDRIVLTCEPHDSLYNPAGTVQGGIIASWLDAAMGGAVHTIVPRGASLTTADMQVNFFRPVTVESGTLRCEGTLVHRGKTLVSAQARLVDAGGTLFAQATSTCVILDA